MSSSVSVSEVLDFVKQVITDQASKNAGLSSRQLNFYVSPDASWGNLLDVDEGITIHVRPARGASRDLQQMQASHDGSR